MVNINQDSFVTWFISSINVTLFVECDLYLQHNHHFYLDIDLSVKSSMTVPSGDHTFVSSCKTPKSLEVEEVVVDPPPGGGGGGGGEEEEEEEDHQHLEFHPPR